MNKIIAHYRIFAIYIYTSNYFMNNSSRENKTDPFIDAIPMNGSLGVLALGAVGVVAWRKKREAAGLSMMQGTTLIGEEKVEETSSK